MAETIFDKYGGLPTVSQIVHDFYRDVLANDMLKPYFTGINMSVLMDHQVKLFSHVLGGPVQFDLTRLKTAHQDLAINDEAFQEVAQILQETLEDAGMEDDDVVTVMEIVASTYHDIVSP